MSGKETMIIGRYQIKAQLGRGGMATVLRAHDPRFKRDVALKMLPREFLHEPTFLARFEREAQTMAQLDHPAIVPVYDFGEDKGQPYIVMRLMSGGSLADRLKQGTVPLEQINTILQRIGSALDHAHSRGVIHRDLKPANILFDQYNDPFLADFGIAHLLAAGGTLTQKSVIGTPAYMSPEQIQGNETLDGRSDIYTLGVILFEMLTGRPPYQAETLPKVMMKHVLDPIPNPREAKPDLPPGCDELITQVMAKDRAKRYGSAVALAAAFAGLLGGAALVGAVAQADPPAPPPPAKTVDSSPTQVPMFRGGLKLEKLECPSCGAPISLNIGPNRQFECESCGSVLIMTEADPGEVLVACPQCQTPNNDTVRYCSKCGASLKAECIRCYTENRIDAVYCSNCGANLKWAKSLRRGMQETREQLLAERAQTFKEKELRQQQEKIERLLGELDRPDNLDFTMYQLRQIGGEAVEALADALGEPEHSVACRCSVAQLLGEICSQSKIKAMCKARAGAALIKTLADPTPLVRSWAARSLGAFKYQPAVEPLGALLKDPDKEVRQQAEAALHRIGGPRAEELIQNAPKGLMGWLKGK
jgi:serine/threonine protein kinase